MGAPSFSPYRFLTSHLSLKRSLRIFSNCTRLRLRTRLSLLIQSDGQLGSLHTARFDLRNETLHLCRYLVLRYHGQNVVFSDRLQLVGDQ